MVAADSPNGIDPSTKAIVEKIKQVFSPQSYLRVLLVNPLQFPDKLINLKIAKKKRYYEYPPYGLRLLCANLNKRGYDVENIDLNEESVTLCSRCSKEISLEILTELWQENVKYFIDKFMPDLVGLTSMFRYLMKLLLKLLICPNDYKKT